MKKLLYFLFLVFIAGPVRAEQYTCTYTWQGKREAHPILIDVQGNKAVIKGGVLNILKEAYEVVSNTDTELLIYRKFTKENSGANYPVGFTVMALDKKTNVFVRSNTFAGTESNSLAFGKCGAI